MGKSVLIAGKGGAGKTTAAAALGAALAGKGHQTVLVDASFGLRGLDLVLGEENRVVNHLLDVMLGRCPLEEACVPSVHYHGLTLLSAPQTKTVSDVDPEAFGRLVSSLKEKYDYVLTDLSAGIGPGLSMAVPAADAGIIVVTPDRACVRAADRISELMKREGLRDLYLFFNRVCPERMQKKIFPEPDEISELLGLPVLGLLTEEEFLADSQETGSPWMLSENPSSERVKRAADRLLGVEVPPEKLEERKKGFWKRLFS